MSKKAMNYRGLTSLLTTASFIIMTWTGIVAFFMPQGRVAYWVDWKFWGLTKTGWDNIHIISSFLFVAASGFHLYFNWGIFRNYLYHKIQKAVTMKKELAVAAALSVVIVVGSIYPVVPFKNFLDLGAWLKDSWVVSPEYEPPFGHAELVSLNVFSKKMNIDLDKALAELAAGGIEVADSGDTLEAIARANGTSAKDLYLLIRKHEQKEAYDPGKAYTPESVEVEFAGTGIGRKTLAQICREIGIDEALAKKRLMENSMEIRDDETLKKAGERYNLDSIEFLKIILVPGYRKPV